MSFWSASRKLGADVKRVSFILPSLNSGGAERVCLNLAKGFLARGIEVDFLLLTSSVQLQVPEGARIVFLSSRKGKNQALYGAIALFKLWRRFSCSKPTDVFVSSVRGAVILSLLAAMFARPTPRLFVREAALYASKSWYPEFCHRFALKRLYPISAGVVAVSQSIKKELVQTFGYQGKIFVVHNPVDTCEIEKLSVSTPKASRFSFTFLAVGRLVEEKGFCVLLRAFSEISCDKSCGLYIVGSGELEPKLRSLAAELKVADQVVWVGYQANPYPWFKIADAFVLSSISEGFVNVLAEALALGVPNIVATNCGGGPEELLEKHRSAWIVPPNNIDELASAMKKAKESHQKRGVPYYRSVPDISSISDKYLTIFFKPG